MDFPFPTYHFDENLKEVPDFLEAFEKFIETAKNSEGKSRELLTKLGVAYRITHQLELAEECLTEALLRTYATKQEELVFAAKIRLAHCFQWQKRYILSGSLFEELEEHLPIVSVSLQAFFWQHKGKNEFDQGHYQIAKGCFQKALEIRVTHRLPHDLIESSQIALSETSKRIEWKCK